MPQRRFFRGSQRILTNKRRGSPATLNTFSSPTDPEGRKELLVISRWAARIKQKSDHRIGANTAHTNTSQNKIRAIRMACCSIDLSILVNQGPSARKRCRIILANARLGSSSHGDALIRKQLEQTAQSIRKTQRVLLLNKEPVFAVSTQLFY